MWGSEARGGGGEGLRGANMSRFTGMALPCECHMMTSILIAYGSYVHPGQTNVETANASRLHPHAACNDVYSIPHAFHCSLAPIP